MDCCSRRHFRRRVDQQRGRDRADLRDAKRWSVRVVAVVAVALEAIQDSAALVVLAALGLSL